jgi:hypothetical protein
MAAATTAVGVVLMTGCYVESASNEPSHHETQSVPLDKAEMVKVDLKMGVGELRVQGGSTNLMDADFTYRSLSWKPIVRYDGGGFRGHLTVEQPNSHSHRLHNDYRWDLKLNDSTPLDMDVRFGVGEGRLDLGSLELRGLTVNMGVGELTVDLRGNPKNDYNVTIHGGVGEATVYLPAKVGIVAEAHGGIGGIKTTGLRQQSGRYVNDAYDNNAKVNVRIQVHGGVGAINLIADER